MLLLTCVGRWVYFRQNFFTWKFCDFVQFVSSADREYDKENRRRGAGDQSIFKTRRHTQSSNAYGIGCGFFVHACKDYFHWEVHGGGGSRATLDSNWYPRLDTCRKVVAPKSESSDICPTFSLKNLSAHRYNLGSIWNKSYRSWGVDLIAGLSGPE